MTSHPLGLWHRSFLHLCAKETFSLDEAHDDVAGNVHVKYALKSLPQV